jgi:hypothetical protein
MKPNQSKTNGVRKQKGQARLRSSDGLGDFARLLKTRGVKLRAGCKMTVNTTTFKTNVLPTIELKVSSRKWLPLKMWDGRWYFKTEAERDRTLKALVS